MKRVTLAALSLMFFFAPFAPNSSGQIQQQKAPDKADKIKPYDETEKWKYPYQATETRIKKIEDNLTAIKQNMTYAEVIEKLGAPDAVHDLRTGFFGLSPREDGMMMRYRGNFSYRAIWYWSKKSENANLNDKWFAVYLGQDEKTVLARLGNNIEVPK
ncbi:MAG TPA: hypothetical protein VKE91_01240 [Blastocatellia bacterium]|nr:hypothetical protein [Blastocatellia bacterium]